MENDIHDKLDRARAVARDNIDRATASLKQGVDMVSTRARSATSDMGKTMEGARVQAGKAAGEANRLITEHPFAAIAAGVAVGALLAHLLPKRKRAKAAPPPETAEGDET